MPKITMKGGTTRKAAELKPKARRRILNGLAKLKGGSRPDAAAPHVSRDDVVRVATAIHDMRGRVSVADFENLADAIRLMDWMQRALAEPPASA